MKSAKGAFIYRCVEKYVWKWIYLLSFSQEENEMRDILSFCPLSLRRLGSCHPVKKLLYNCLARRVSFVSLLLCPGTLVTRLTLIGVFLSPARPCLPYGLTPVSCPERCCWSTSSIHGLLVAQPGLSRSCRLLAHFWSWCEINWHNSKLRRWCQKEEQKTCEIEKNKHDVKLSAGILQLERFDFSFTAWLLCLAAVQDSIYSFWDLWLSQQLRGFLYQGRFATVWKDYRFFMLLCRLICKTGKSCHICKNYCDWWRVWKRRKEELISELSSGYNGEHFVIGVLHKYCTFYNGLLG